MYDKRSKILVVGAGGICNAILFALQKHGCKQIYVSNRTLEKAQTVASKFNVECIPFKDMKFINPEFMILDDKSLFSCEEGCLSIPGITEEITRPDQIKATWQDIEGNYFEDQPTGLLAVCFQHEIDHLEGKLLVDYMSSLKRDRIRKKALKA